MPKKEREGTTLHFHPYVCSLPAPDVLLSLPRYRIPVPSYTHWRLDGLQLQVLFSLCPCLLRGLHRRHRRLPPRRLPGVGQAGWGVLQGPPQVPVCRGDPPLGRGARCGHRVVHEGHRAPRPLRCVPAAFGIANSKSTYRVNKRRYMSMDFELTNIQLLERYPGPFRSNRATRHLEGILRHLCTEHNVAVHIS